MEVSSSLRARLTSATANHPRKRSPLWGKEQVLGDMVRVIRRFRPDVILSRFSPDASSGHGHHTAIGHLAREAYEASADPGHFPEQIKQGLQPWQATRLYWSPPLFTRSQEEAQALRADRIRINTGEYDPELGASYAEIGGVARSMHRSQGMGTRQRKGDAPAFFGYVAGEKAERDLFERIDTSWDRVPGAERVKSLLTKVLTSHKTGNRDAVIEGLFRAYQEVKALDGPWARHKEQEMVRAIELASGLWIDAAAERWDVTPGSEVELTLSAMNRSSAWLYWEDAEVAGTVTRNVPIEARHLRSNDVVQQTVLISIPEEAEYSQPSWLRRPVTGNSYQIDDPGMIGQAESPPPLSVSFRLKGPDGVKFTVRRAVIFRWIDPTEGERTRRVEVAPAVAVSLDNSSRIFPDAQPRTVAVDLDSHTDNAEGSVSLSVPPGWITKPASLPYRLERRGMRTTLVFDLHPPKKSTGGAVVANVKLGDRTINHGVREIKYPHIPLQVVFPRAEMRVERVDVKLLAKNIGYVMGSGDRIPEALKQLEAEVTLLSDEDVTSGELSSFDTIVLGIRALRTRPGVLAAKERLLGYVENGGTLIVQYETLSRRGATATAGSVSSHALARTGQRRTGAGASVASAAYSVAAAQCHYREGLQGLGTGARALFHDEVGRAVRRPSRIERSGRTAASGRLAVRALWQGRLHLHRLFVVPATAGGRAGGLSHLREPAQRRGGSERITGPASRRSQRSESALNREGFAFPAIFAPLRESGSQPSRTICSSATRGHMFWWM